MRRETSLGELLSGHPWKIVYLATYDFLLASMIRWVGLHSESVRDQTVSEQSVCTHTRDRCSALLSALEDSDAIWAEWCTVMNGVKASTEYREIYVGPDYER